MYNGLPLVESLEAWGVGVDTLGTYNERTLIWLDESRLSCKRPIERRSLKESTFQRLVVMGTVRFWVRQMEPLHVVLPLYANYYCHQEVTQPP